MNTIQILNDKLRRNIFNSSHNKVVMTTGISNLPFIDQLQILNKIKTFNDFNEGNDPYGEHDFGKIEYKGNNYFFKIDYYDPSLEYASDDPSNPDITTRVLTVMRADEY